MMVDDGHFLLQSQGFDTHQISLNGHNQWSGYQIYLKNLVHLDSLNMVVSTG